MFRPFALFLAALAWQTLAALSTNATGLDLAPWTTLGINGDDAASFAASGVSPAEGAQIIAAEAALFNGTQASNVPGAYSAATAMGVSMGDTANGVNLKLVVVVGWRRQHVGITWQKKGSATVDLSIRFRDALFKLCPGGQPSDRACGYRDEERITDIYYNRGTKAYVGISIASYEMPTYLRPLFINTLWGVFKEITDCDANRYQLRGFKGHEACREFANSADQIEVRLENTRGPNDTPGIYKDPHLRVRIQFNGKTDEGQFDCVGAQSVIWDQVRQRMIPEINKIPVYKGAQVDFDVLCVSPRVDGGCEGGPICRHDPRWTDIPGNNGEKGSCFWHDKCSTPSHCIFSL